MNCIDAQQPIYWIFSSDVPSLVYYSHIPASLISLFVGFFVFFKNSKLLSAKLLLIISFIFSLWSFLGIITWANIDSGELMFSWSLFPILYGALFIFCLYFVYVFIDKKDVSLKIKIIWSLLFLPIILSVFKYLFSFDLINCEPDGYKFVDYYLFVFILILFLWVIIISILRYRKAQKDFKKQILYLSIGISFFLLAFFITTYAASFLGNFQIDQYGLFGMTFFMGMLAFLIVKFKAFNIKLIGAQALMISLIILIGSEFFFIPLDNLTNIILISITLLLAVIFGMMLIDSVKKENQRKEELQDMSNKLAGANDQLRKLDNAKSEFISIASHQLRTPLTAVKGFISLLLEGSYGKIETKQQEVLNKVYTSNDRLIHLVEDLLNVSRMESGRMEFKLDSTDLKAICKEVMDTFYIRAKDAGLYLEYKPTDEEMPKVMIDGVKMREVISNLVDNAIKYCPKGGVTLKVEKIGDFERVTVSDTGIGIPESEIPYLFAKFSRGKDISRLNTGGTGLGLFVGKSIVEANGSKLWAESDGAGLGSRFIIEIPINQDPEIIKRWS